MEGRGSKRNRERKKKKKKKKKKRKKRRAIVEARDKNKVFNDGARKYKGRDDNREEEKTRVYTIGDEDD